MTTFTLPTIPRRATKSGPWRRLIAALATLAAVTLGVTGCGPDAGAAIPDDTTVVRFALDWTPNTNHTGLYVALERGYFDEAGIEVELLPFNQSLPDQLIDAGQAEFGISFQSTVSYTHLTLPTNREV